MSAYDSGCELENGGYVCCIFKVTDVIYFTVSLLSNGPIIVKAMVEKSVDLISSNLHFRKE